MGAICWGPLEEKISLYTEDALIYGFEATFCTLMLVVEEFRDVSGLRAGWDKSITFPTGPLQRYTFLQHSDQHSDLQISTIFGGSFLSLKTTPIVQQLETR